MSFGKPISIGVKNVAVFIINPQTNEQYKIIQVGERVRSVLTIAKDPTEAQNKVESYLNNADYGFSEKRKVFQIAVMAEAADDLAFITNKMLVL